jgi:hypothetical protein
MTVQNLFLIGAGFTRSVFDNAPLNAELLKRLIEIHTQSPLMTLSEVYSTEDIELLLTRLDIDILHGTRPKAVRSDIEVEIAQYFQKFRFTVTKLEECPWLKTFAKEVIRDGDVIVNLNYDCFLDGLLDHERIWHPHSGYGGIENILAEKTNDVHSTTQMLKIHGSEHFTLVECLDRPDFKSVVFEFNESIFPRSASHAQLGPRSILPNVRLPRPGNPMPYIIAPSFVKVGSVELHYLLSHALQSAKNAKNLVIIGCGLRPEDSSLWTLLTIFLWQSEVQERKIVIVDPNAEVISNRIQSFFGNSLKKYIDTIPSDFKGALMKLSAITSE